MTPDQKTAAIAALQKSIAAEQALMAPTQAQLATLQHQVDAVKGVQAQIDNINKQHAPHVANIGAFQAAIAAVQAAV